MPGYIRDNRRKCANFNGIVLGNRNVMLAIALCRQSQVRPFLPANGIAELRKRIR